MLAAAHAYEFLRPAAPTMAPGDESPLGIEGPIEP
jgi:hypothetical protein